MNTDELTTYTEQVKVIASEFNDVQMQLKTHDSRALNIRPRVEKSCAELSATLVNAAQLLTAEMGSQLREQYGTFLIHIEEICECMQDIGNDIVNILIVHNKLLLLLDDVMIKCYEEEGI